MKSTFEIRRPLALAMAILMLVTAMLSVASCTKKPGGDVETTGEGENPNRSGQVYDNESDPLVFSTLELDKVFNPFFSTSGTDSNVVGMTQISMLSNDSQGNPTYGVDEAVVVERAYIHTEGIPDVDQTTTYYFVLKNNVRFSNGSLLTIKDVLFNLYVYLDPAYTGSSTIYSTDIVGLKEYRTQSADEQEQENFMERFRVQAQGRIENLVAAVTAILDEKTNLNAETMRQELTAYSQENGEAFAHIVADYDKALELFRQELEKDWSNSLNSYDEMNFFDRDGQKYEGLFTTDVEAFLYNEGFIRWSKKDGEMTYGAGAKETVRTWTREQAINFVYNANVPDKLAEVLQYWMTATELLTYLTNVELEEESKGTERAYRNISGIRFANKDSAVTFTAEPVDKTYDPAEAGEVTRTYEPPVYNQDGSITGNEVLAITIKGVDPKAIWNFAFAVAPMYYYSDEEHIAAFDFESNFGVEWGSQTFMNQVVKNPDKIGVPVGAGAYAASKSSGGIENVTAGEFYDKGVVYFERNPHFIMGPAAIKKIRFQVVTSTQALNTLYSGEIDFVEPNAKPATIAELNGKAGEGIGNKSIRTSGYGYIGINAGKVPDMAVRQAIMHSISTQECVDYYKNTATPIYRSMSMANWAYPTGATAYYPYIGGPIPENLDEVNPAYAEYVIGLGKNPGQTLTEEEQKAFIALLVEGAGYSENADGVYQKGDHLLKYTFTIAGEETDHPAWQAMYHAGEKLNRWGFDITVATDSNALKKLSTGELTVWAAAWGSTIDPDMFQVYHKDSTATSTNNWGYRQIKQNVGGKYDLELALVEQLSEIIDAARHTTDQTERKELYREALTIVMQLAVELPTYQRDDLFAYNANKIDTSTFTPDSELSPYKGLTGDLHRVSLNVER